MNQSVLSIGDTSKAQNEGALMKSKIEAASVPDELKTTCFAMINRLDKMTESGVYSREHDIISNYINWIVSFPWKNTAEEVYDISRVRIVLNKNHY